MRVKNLLIQKTTNHSLFIFNFCYSTQKPMHPHLINQSKQIILRRFKSLQTTCIKNIQLTSTVTLRQHQSISILQVVDGFQPGQPIAVDPTNTKPQHTSRGGNRYHPPTRTSGFKQHSAR